MSEAQGHVPPSNPFSSRNVRPGAIPFVFAAGESARQVVQRLRAAHWWGQIVGPHGSGKSALVATLAPHLVDAGRRLTCITLHDGQRNLRALARDLAEIDETSLVVVDGYEQLSWFSRWRLKRQCQRKGSGLLVTSHATASLPWLYSTQPSLEMALQIVARLSQGSEPCIRREDVERLYAARRGDLRDVLFDLYDLYEARRRPTA